MMKRFLFALVVCGLGSGLVAHADTVTNYGLTIDGCSGNSCGAGPFGTVQVDEATNMLSAVITVTLNSNVNFSGTGAGDALVFDLLGSPAVTFNITSANFEVDPNPPVHASTFGDFTYGVTCDYKATMSKPAGACHGGSGPSTLTFSISSSTALTFVKNGDGEFFASDVAVTNVDGKVNTGNVGSDSSSTAVTPEPSSLMLLGTGAFGLAGVIRRRFNR